MAKYLLLLCLFILESYATTLNLNLTHFCKDEHLGRPFLVNAIPFEDDPFDDDFSYNCWNCTNHCICNMTIDDSNDDMESSLELGLQLIGYGCGTLQMKRCIFFKPTPRFRNQSLTLTYKFALNSVNEEIVAHGMDIVASGACDHPSAYNKLKKLKKRIVSQPE